MTKRLLLGIVLLFAVTLPLRADFGALAREVSKTPGIKRVYIPFLGLARMAVWIAAPEGVHDFQLATFEGNVDLDGRRFGELIRRYAKGYTPLVQVRERNGHWTYVYARPGVRDRVELMVFVHDKDTVLVRVDVDAARLGRAINSPRSVVNIAKR